MSSPEVAAWAHSSEGSLRLEKCGSVQGKGLKAWPSVCPWAVGKNGAWSPQWMWAGVGLHQRFTWRKKGTTWQVLLRDDDFHPWNKRDAAKGMRWLHLFTYDDAKIKKRGLVVRAVRVHVCDPSIRKVGTERPGFEARFSYIKNKNNNKRVY